MNFPQIGELRDWAVFRVRLDVPVGSSQLESTWPTELGAWAKIEQVGTAVYTESVQTSERITHRVFLRWQPGLGNYHEVVSGGILYRIRRLGDIRGRKQWAVAEVEELGPGAIHE